MSFKLDGVVAMRAKIKQIAIAFPKEAKAALYQEAQIELTESKRRVPVDKGTLRASGQVSKPEGERANISVTISYGGAAQDYAIPVHENLEAFHPTGQAKYLESVLNESAPYMLQRLGRRLMLDDMVL